MGEPKTVKQHSVTLDQDRCIGCTACIKRCPTEAIRVRNKKAVIIEEKCIDCGMCIRICKNNAKKAKADDLSLMDNYKIKIAIPAPTLYSQFKKVHNVNKILTGLKKLGFDEVFEVSKGADLVTEFTKQYIKDNNLTKPIISSACPAVVKVIQSRFPSLIQNIIPVLSPMEITAKIAKNYYINRGYNEKDIGVFFISPCTAKITNSKYPQEIEKSCVDVIVSIKDIYKPLLKAIQSLNEYEYLRLSTDKGIRWASPGGEGEASEITNYISVDGIENVINLLEMIEDDTLKNIDFVECLACTGGCLGGPLTVENPFVANTRMEKVLRYHKNNEETREIVFDYSSIDFLWERSIEPKQVMKLDDNVEVALKKMEQLVEIFDQLPNIDCGSCGAPTCRALAEDIVKGEAHIEDCIFMLKAEVRKMAEQMVKLAEKLPQSIKEK